MLMKPSSTDYPEYYKRYIDSLPNSGILEIYEHQTAEVLDFYKTFSKEKILYRYEPQKWSILEVLGHLNDSEIIMGYRALTYSRNDKSDLPMYDHDDYVDSGNFDSLSIDLLLDHYAAVRKSNLLLFKTFSDEIWNTKGITGGKEFATSSIPYIMVGHTQHHIKVIKEKYL